LRLAERTRRLRRRRCRNIARRFICTLIQGKDRGQSIVPLFFELFHYGTRFARLDRGRDKKCHAPRAARLRADASLAAIDRTGDK
jgi:hypothetical protein